MIEVALEYVDNPNSKLLSSHADAPGVRKIEGRIKPASFSIVNPGTPSPGPRNKRPRLMNLNISPDSALGRSRDHKMRGSACGGHRGGRGSYNRNFRLDNQTAPGPNDAFVFSSSTRRASSATKPPLSIDYSAQTNHGQVQNASPNYNGKIQAYSPGTTSNENSLGRPNPRLTELP